MNATSITALQIFFFMVNIGSLRGFIQVAG